MLVLGAADTGKSTLIRNIRMIHEHNFTNEEMFRFRLSIRAISFNALASLSKSLGKESFSGGLAKDVEKFQLRVEKGQVIGNSDHWCCEARLFELALKIWTEPLVQEAIAAMDNSDLFLANLGVILEPNYVPSHDDILSLRMPTTGTHHTTIESEEMIMTIIDVGGERSERKKWLHCFESVNAVLFVASLAEYDLYVPEDPETIRMHESLRLFESICNVKWFAHATLLLFLNKKDIFEEKIKTKPLTVCFPDYDGPLTSYEATTTHVCRQFEKQCKLDRQIYRHFTCAKDKSNIAKVFASVKDDILRTTLATVGLT